MEEWYFERFFTQTDGDEEYCSYLPREERLQELEEAWNACGGRIFFIGGRAGSGKSSLARAYALKHVGAEYLYYADACVFEAPRLLSREEMQEPDVVAYEYEKLVFYKATDSPGDVTIDTCEGLNRSTLLVLHVNYDLDVLGSEGSGGSRELETLRKYLDQLSTRKGVSILVTVRWEKPAQDVYILGEDANFARALYDAHAFTARDDEAEAKWWEKTDRMLAFTGYHPSAARMLSIFEDRVNSKKTELADEILAQYTSREETEDVTQESVRRILRETILESRDYTDAEIQIMHFLSLFPERRIRMETIAAALQLTPVDVLLDLAILRWMGFVRWKPDFDFGPHSNRFCETGDIEINRMEAEVLRDYLWKNGYVDRAGEVKFVKHIFGNIMGRFYFRGIWAPKDVLRSLMRDLGGDAFLLYHAVCEATPYARGLAEKALAERDGQSVEAGVPETVVVRVEYPDGVFYGLHRLEQERHGVGYDLSVSGQESPGNRYDLTAAERVQSVDILCKTQGLTLNHIRQMEAVQCVVYEALLFAGRSVRECEEYGEVTEYPVYRRPEAKFWQPEQICGNRASLIANDFVCGKERFLSSIRLAEGLIEIGDRAFLDCAYVHEKLELPAGLQRIGKKAFYRGRGFKGDLIIPESMQAIGEDAFAYGGFDGELVLPESRIEIGSGAFGACKNLKGRVKVYVKGKYSPSSFLECDMLEILGVEDEASGKGIAIRPPTSMGKLPDSGKLQGKKERAVWRQTLVNKMLESSKLQGALPELPPALEEIRDRAFFNEDKLTGELKLPDGLKKIGKEAFSGCREFTGDLILPSGVEIIREKAFYGCSGFDGELRLPEKLVVVESSCFALCKGFTGILEVPEHIIEIMNEAFFYCDHLEGLVLSEGLTRIGEKAFAGCLAFSGELVLPATLRRMEKCAFLGCHFQTVTFLNPDTVIGIGNFDSVKGDRPLICGYRNSTAEEYAEKNFFEFEEIPG
ncbi:MAG: leucine-rich repeat domain-containing protein [Lachnospiraceae bacterium]|nr:leucine-rich repeat domain-containing protein [Lachnospiraceae bacterium]